MQAKLFVTRPSMSRSFQHFGRRCNFGINKNRIGSNSKLSCLMLALSICLTLSSCVPRTEVDYYTITTRDTTYKETVHNVPGSKEDNGVVFPSSRVTEIARVTTSYDSTYEHN